MEQDALPAARGAETTERFILLSLMAFADPDAADPGPADVDPREVVRVSHEHRVLPFVARALSERGLLVHWDAASQAQALFSIEDARRLNALRREQFRTVRALLAARGVEVVPLKGIATSAGVHAAFPVRPMWDVDVLVRRRDLDAALRALEAAGFRFHPSTIRYRWHDELSVRHAAVDPRDPDASPLGRFGMDDGVFAVDVHYAPIYSGTRLDVAGFWERSLAWPEMGEGVRRLCDADLLFHTLAHAIESRALLGAFDAMMLMARTGVRRLPDVPGDAAVAAALGRTSAGGRDPRDVETLRHFFAPRPRVPGPPLWPRLSAAERALYLLGYLLPNPRFYRGSPNPYARHYRTLFAKTVRALARAPRRAAF